MARRCFKVELQRLPYLIEEYLQGHWWERAGIFSDQGLQDERLTAALCAGNVLRNLASAKFPEPFQASAAFHELLVSPPLPGCTASMPDTPSSGQSP